MAKREAKLGDVQSYLANSTEGIWRMDVYDGGLWRFLRYTQGRPDLRRFKKLFADIIREARETKNGK